MNILEAEDLIKGSPDQTLLEEAQNPTGQVPQYLVMSEIQRRTDMRKRFEAEEQQPTDTVAEQIMAESMGGSAPPPMAPQGAPMPPQNGMPPQMPPQMSSAPPQMPPAPVSAQMPPEMPPPEMMAAMNGMPPPGMMPPQMMSNGGMIGSIEEAPNAILEDARKFRTDSMENIPVGDMMAMSQAVDMGIPSVLPMSRGGVVRMQDLGSVPGQLPPEIMNLSNEEIQGYLASLGISNIPPQLRELMERRQSGSISPEENAEIDAEIARREAEITEPLSQSAIPQAVQDISPINMPVPPPPIDTAQSILEEISGAPQRREDLFAGVPGAVEEMGPPVPADLGASASDRYAEMINSQVDGGSVVDMAGKIMGPKSIGPVNPNVNRVSNLDLLGGPQALTGGPQLNKDLLDLITVPAGGVAVGPDGDPGGGDTLEEYVVDAKKIETGDGRDSEQEERDAEYQEALALLGGADYLRAGITRREDIDKLVDELGSYKGKDIPQVDYSDLIEGSKEKSRRDAISRAFINLGAGIARGDIASGLEKAGLAVADVQDRQAELNQALEIAQRRSLTDAETAKATRDIGITTGQLNMLLDLEKTAATLRTSSSTSAMRLREKKINDLRVELGFSLPDAIATVDGYQKATINPETGAIQFLTLENGKWKATELPVDLSDIKISEDMTKDIAAPEPGRTLFALHSYASGPPSGVKAFLAYPAAWIGKDIFARNTAARQIFRLATQDLVRSLSLNTRFPSTEQDFVRNTVSGIHPQFAVAPDLLRNRMVALKDYLEVRVMQEQETANDTSLSDDARKGAETAATGIKNFLAILGSPEDAAVPSVDPDAGNPPQIYLDEGWDPADWAFISKEKRDEFWPTT